MSSPTRVPASGVNLRRYFAEIMNTYLQARAQSFGGHSIGNLMRQTLPQEIKKLDFTNEAIYKVQGSVGQGSWAAVPWIAIMDKRITETTQQGEYIVYLFSEDMRSLYLAFILGVTEPLQKGRKEGEEYLRKKVADLRDLLPFEKMAKDDQIALTSSGRGKDYQLSTVAYIRYERERLPDNGVLIADLKNMMDNYVYYVNHLVDKPEGGSQVNESNSIMETPLSPLQILAEVKAFIVERGFFFPEGMIDNFYLSLKTKPFVLLAGISGTGKTRLVQLFAEALGATEKNGRFSIIPVRPDWSDPSDLLGYRDITGVFKAGRLTRLFWEASQPENRDKPYFVCLDEMNLARVEHYFSDLLSIMETRRFSEGEIRTDSLLESEVVCFLADRYSAERFPATDSDSKEIITALGIPDNVYIIGTVNMDETTHPFSKKVLDRAQTIEFNDISLEFYPVDSADGAKSAAAAGAFGRERLKNDFLRSDYLVLKDAYAGNERLIQRTTQRLVQINRVLEEVHSHVGFRTRDLVCFYMLYNERFGLLSEDEAFDLQLLQKILPRLQGSHASLKRVLIELMALALGKKLNVEEFMEDASELFLSFRNTEAATPSGVYLKSARKIAYMLRRLEEDGFTSFWLS